VSIPPLPVRGFPTLLDFRRRLALRESPRADRTFPGLSACPCICTEKQFPSLSPPAFVCPPEEPRCGVPLEHRSVIAACQFFHPCGHQPCNISRSYGCPTFRHAVNPIFAGPPPGPPRSSGVQHLKFFFLGWKLFVCVLVLSLGAAVCVSC